MKNSATELTDAEIEEIFGPREPLVLDCLNLNFEDEEVNALLAPLRADFLATNEKPSSIANVKIPKIKLPKFNFSLISGNFSHVNFFKPGSIRERDIKPSPPGACRESCKLKR
jgi:hypothetical protein